MEPVTRDRTKWTISLIGAIDIRRPEGRAVPLPTRKIAGILCVLSVAGESVVARKDLAEILWPDAPPSQQGQNLRSALASLRRELGDDAPVEITRSTCRLITERVSTDFPPATANDWARLAIELEGPWFERLRAGQLGAGRVSRTTESKVVEDSFNRVLKWAADDDPYRAVELMRAAPELTASLPGSELVGLVNKIQPHVPSSHPLYGWLVHFNGVARYLHFDIPGGLESLRVAAEHAMNRKETRLLGETVRWQAAPRIAVGDAPGAAQMIQRSLAQVISQGDREAAAQLLHAQGIAYHHLGRFAAADQSLVRALDEGYYRRHVLARAHLLANISIFRAVGGGVTEARSASLEALDLVKDRPDDRITAACNLTSALLNLREREPDAAEKNLESILRTQTRNFTTIGIYAQESAAYLWLQRGDRGEAEHRLQESTRLRRKAQMGVTRWDQARLQPAFQALHLA